MTTQEGLPALATTDLLVAQYRVLCDLKGDMEVARVTMPTGDLRAVLARLEAAERQVKELRVALQAEQTAEDAFDAADEYMHRADAEDWLNDPTGSLHVKGAYDRAHDLRKKSKELRRAALEAKSHDD